MLNNVKGQYIFVKVMDFMDLYNFFPQAKLECGSVLLCQVNMVI